MPVQQSLRTFVSHVFYFTRAHSITLAEKSGNNELLGILSHNKSILVAKM